MMRLWRTTREIKMTQRHEWRFSLRFTHIECWCTASENVNVIGALLRLRAQIMFMSRSVDGYLGREMISRDSSRGEIKARLQLSVRDRIVDRIAVFSPLVLLNTHVSLSNWRGCSDVLRRYLAPKLTPLCVRSLAAAKLTWSDDKNTTIIFGARTRGTPTTTHTFFTPITRLSWPAPCF